MADDGYLVGFEDGSGNFVEVGRFNNQAEDIDQPIEIRHTNSGNQITLGADGIDTPQVPDSEKLAGETREEVMPSGGIIMWSGSTTNIPTGWTLCDGTNGAPDLRDRFIAGAGGEYNTNDTGGEDSVTLTESEMPSHNHSGTTTTNGEHSHEYEGNNIGNRTFGFPDNTTVIGSTTESTSLAGSHSHNLNINNTGGDQAHENRPQFYALAFIYKL
jgi:microcystin-dependent protein